MTLLIIFVLKGKDQGRVVNNMSLTMNANFYCKVSEAAADLKVRNAMANVCLRYIFSSSRYNKN